MTRRRSLFDNSLLFSPPSPNTQEDNINNNNRPIASSSSTPFNHNGASRASFLSARLSSFSSEFATLFRSHTISAQKLSAFKVLQSGYADNSHDPNRSTTSQNVNSHSISSPPPPQMQDERPSRKQKSENRFYSFLTRSRSRSRSSKHDHEPQSSQPANKSSSKSRISTNQKSAVKPSHSLPSPPQSPGSKPVSRIQSRPLSSTTTATNTTITPATPKARRHNQALPGSPSSVKTSRPTTAPAVTAPVTARQPSNSNSTASSHQSQAASKTAGGARRKLHELFSLPLRRKSTSRSRSRSRPSTPVLLSPAEVPPLPIPVSPGLSLGYDDDDNDVTPRPNSKASPPYPDLAYIERRTPSPTPGPRILKVMNPSTPTATPGSTTIKLPRIFSGSSKPTPSKQSSMDSALTTPPTPSTSSHPLPPLPTSTISTSLVSHPLKRVPSSSHYRRSSASTATEGTYATPLNSSVVVNHVGMSSTSSLGHSKLTPPTIIHTPPTPLKPGENLSGNGTQPPPLPTKTGYGLGTSRLGFHHHAHAMKGSLDSGYRYRINTSMGVVDEEGRASPARSSSVKLKGEVKVNGKERETSNATPVPSTIPRVSTTKMSSAVRATKHGSFDFERPGAWGSIVPPGMQRTGSNSTNGSAASGNLGYELGTRKHEKERDSTYGPGLAGVGTLQRDVSMRRGKEREEELKRKEEEAKRKEKEKEREKERARRRPSSSERREKEKRPLTANSSQRTTPTGSDQAHGSTSTNGKGSSWGKAAGIKRSKMGSGGGVSRIGTLSGHHPLFDFEPPVPSPTRSTGSTSGHGQGNNGVFSNGYSAYGSLYYEKAVEKEQQRVREEKERHSSTKKSSSDKDRSAVPVPSLPSPIGTIPSGTTSSGGVPVISHATRTTLIQKPLPPISTHQPPMYTASGHRSGTKGHSLDLGLGLAWAPTKVRADALLPSSTFFVRSLSQGGGSRNGYKGRNGVGSVEMGRSASGDSGSRSNGHGRGKGEPGDLSGVERSKLGREVAELFRSALDHDGYALFKNYVHKFDAHEIPFDGPNGIVTLVQRLLVNAPHLEEEGRTRLLDRFIRIILQQA